MISKECVYKGVCKRSQTCSALRSQVDEGRMMMRVVKQVGHRRLWHGQRHVLRKAESPPTQKRLIYQHAHYVG